MFNDTHHMPNNLTAHQKWLHAILCGTMTSYMSILHILLYFMKTKRYQKHKARILQSLQIQHVFHQVYIVPLLLLWAKKYSTTAGINDIDFKSQTYYMGSLSCYNFRVGCFSVKLTLSCGKTIELGTIMGALQKVVILITIL